MGEVYRATDTKLHRDVALKVLPEEFSRDAERMARLEREAHLLASLNHPNIAAIHGLEESNGVRALVMELVDGPTLAERIAQGPIPIDEALPIARQIAEALEYAHERGIIHRDLKPANVKLTGDGSVKVLDFGLAKAIEGDSATADASKSPTLTLAATRAGVILGTAAYMSPEQAKGKPADRRADIWAFGVVLYEMLAGQPLYTGETVSEILAHVITQEPRWEALPENTSPKIRLLLGRCLTKDPKQRLQAIGEARITFDTAAIETGSVAAVAPRPLWWRTWPWAVLSAALTLAVLVLVWRPWQESPKPALPVRLSVQLGVDAHLGSDWGAHAVLSPDGRLLAFAGRGTDQKWRVYVRRLDQLHATPLSGTDGARNISFSPDGEWIAFFAEGKLKKISAQGGSAVTLCDALEDRGGSWGEDGTIVFAEWRGGLCRVPSTGGAPEPLTTLDQTAGEVSHHWPQTLPGAKALLFTAHSSLTNFDNAVIVAQSLETGKRKTVIKGGYYARYAPSGHLLYVNQGTLFAVPFDVNRLELSGQPIPMVANVATNPNTGGAQLDFSQTGTLVYLPGKAAAGVSIYWMDQAGKMTPLLQAKGDYISPRFSPDGKRLALEIKNAAASDVWIYDLERDTLTRLTFDGAQLPVWTPDGRRITFRSGKDGAPGIYWKRADGSGDAQRLTDSKNLQVPFSWRPDGKILAFQERNPKTSWDIWTLPIKGDEPSGWEPGKPELFLGTSYAELQPVFSPDGRWLAYTSNDSGRFEVYVRPFPGPGGKWQISTDGGVFPKWSPSGKELFYRTDDQRIWVSTYSASPDAFVAGRPRQWSEGRFADRALASNFDVAPDGKRFAVLKAPEGDNESRTDKVIFIENFFDELRRIAPVK